MAKEGLPVQTSCRILEVSESGFYEWRNRPPSERSLRHAWLTQLITEVHTTSHGTYGARRIHAELTLGHDIAVGHGNVEMLMRAAGVKGLPGNKRARSKHQTPTASDLVDRKFTRDEPNKLWVTDITEHPTREGKIYCAVAKGYVFEASRRVVYRQLADSDIGDKRSRNGHFQSRPNTRHTHSLGPRSAVHVLGIHPPGARLRAGPVDGIDRRLL
ncbi:putative transposase [Gordonia alkanivorans NBRC 16433]|uniref:Putative transposase n=1 Tax=Gordonia alkanivorans NBRC 16433 TaxID=1027371 RepID=F9VRR6_9ACTN|nr:putative transposase [Gordonia alkanivorans NBRC 16433]